MKNSAFAVDPCPRDLLGKQWLFMHMSAHYRRMWSAQSVVDSAPPVSLKTLKKSGTTPRSVRRPHTVAVDYSEGLQVPALATPPGARTPRAASASTPAKPSSASTAASPGLCLAFPARRADAADAVAQRVLQRQSVRPQRSAQLSRPVRLSQKPSRADTDPGQGVAPRAAHAHAHGQGPRVQGRAAAGASQRQFDYGGHGGAALRKPPSLARHRRRDLEKPGTYYDKLNQLVPDQLPQRSAPRTSGQFLSEVFTPRVPHKPQVLKTEVPSRLKFSSSYCPPRPKTLQSKLGVPGQEISTDAEQPIWATSRSSPPVSSRDSAYNGGISSGGESRGPTPDHKGCRKHPKRSERKSRKKVDQKRPHSADAKIRRKLENKLRKKLVETERNEIHEQRLRVDPWSEVNHDDRGDEILRNINNLHIDSHGDDSLTERGSPVNTGSVSDQSVDEDLGDEADELVDEDVADEADESVDVDTKEDDVEDSLTKDEEESSIKDESSASADSVKSQPPTQIASLSNKQQVGTQTEFQVLSKSGSRVHSTSSRRHIHSPTQSTGTSKTMTKQSSSDHSSSPSHSSTQQLSAETSSKEMETMSQVTPLDFMGQSKALVSFQNSESSKNEQNTQTTEPNPSKIKPNCSLKDIINGVSYKKLVHDITEDLIRNGIVTDKGFRTLSQEHMQANSKLDRTKMEEEINKLYAQLEIPRNSYLNSKICGEDQLKKGQTSFLSEVNQTSPYMSPLVSAPSDILNHHDLGDQVLQKLLILPNQAIQFKQCLFPLESPLKSTESGLMSAKRFSGVLDSENKPIITEEGQGSHKNTVNSFVWSIKQMESFDPEQHKLPASSPLSKTDEVALPYSHDVSSLVGAEFNQKTNISDFFDVLNLRRKGSIPEDMMKSEHVQQITLTVADTSTPAAQGASSDHEQQISPNALKQDESYKSVASSMLSDLELSNRMPESCSLSPTALESLMKSKVSNNDAFSDALSNHNLSCFCKEQNCACASFEHMENFFVNSWMNGLPTVPIINSKFCSQTNEVASKIPGAGKERKSQGQKTGCKCNVRVDAAQAPQVHNEIRGQPEIVTIFRKTEILKNYSEVSDRIGGFLAEEHTSNPKVNDTVAGCITEGNLVEDARTVCSDAFNNSGNNNQTQTNTVPGSKTYLENLSSCSVGTGVNSDIRRHYKSLENES